MSSTRRTYLKIGIPIAMAYVGLTNTCLIMSANIDEGEKPIWQDPLHLTMDVITTLVSGGILGWLGSKAAYWTRAIAPTLEKNLEEKIFEYDPENPEPIDISKYRSKGNKFLAVGTTTGTLASLGYLYSKGAMSNALLTSPWSYGLLLLSTFPVGPSLGVGAYYVSLKCRAHRMLNLQDAVTSIQEEPERTLTDIQKERHMKNPTSSSNPYNLLEEFAEVERTSSEQATPPRVSQSSWFHRADSGITQGRTNSTPVLSRSRDDSE